MAEVVRWGVLGHSQIGRVCVVPAIQTSPNGQVVALASRSPDRARDFVAQQQIPRLYDTYEALLTDPDIEVVYIPLPNHLHHNWTLRALAAGKHVLCEKPLAVTTTEAQAMAIAAQESGCLLMEALMYRFHPRTRYLKQLLGDGAIGAPRFIRTAFTFTVDDAANVRLDPTTGGGALLDVGCYGVSLACWLLDAEPDHLSGQAVYNPQGAEVSLVGVMHFQPQTLAIVEASFIAGLQQTFSIVGSQGTLELPHDAFIPWERDAVFTQRGRDDDTGHTHRIPGVDEYRLMVENFSAAVRGDTTPDIPLADSLRTLRVIDALRATLRQQSNLPTQPTQPGVS